jgi:hypothetical protein
VNKKLLQGRVVAVTDVSKGISLGIVQHGAQVVGGRQDISGAAVAGADGLSAPAHVCIDEMLLRPVVQDVAH